MLYDYRDADGRVVCSVARESDKKFRRLRSVNGRDVWNWDGVQVVPYNLPAFHKKNAVILVEGEKDVDSLRKLRLPATTIPGGSNGWGPLMKSQPDFCRKYFDGKNIFIIPDNDGPGRKFMNTAARYLHSAGAADVKVCDICADMEHGADVSDWIDANSPDTETILSVLESKAVTWQPPEEATSILDKTIHVPDELRKPPATGDEYDITAVFKDITTANKGSWSADTFNCRCPAHDDNRASLSVTLKEDKVLLYCHAGCEFRSICEGLKVKPHQLFRTGRAHLKAVQQQIPGPRPEDLKKVCEKVLNTDEPGDYDGTMAPIMQDYVGEISEMTDAHPVIIYSTALAAVGAQAQTRLVIQKGHYYVRLYPNIWALSVAESGTFKTTALNAGAAPLMEREKSTVSNVMEVQQRIKNLLEAGAEEGDPEVAQLLYEKDELNKQRRRLPDKASWEACIDRIDSCGGGIWTLSEFGAWLSGLEKSYNQGFKQTVTELYDVPETYEESTRTHGTRILQKPFLAISGVSTIEFLSGLLSRDDASTGFLARFLLMRPPARNTVPDALPTNDRVERDLESYKLLQQIYLQLADMTVPIEYRIGDGARKVFDQYHRSMFDRFYKMTESERVWMEPFVKRFGPNALKVAMVSQFLINSSENVIGDHAMLTGISLVSYSEICTRFLFRRELGESNFERKARIVVAWLAKQGGSCILKKLYSSKALGGGAKDYDYILRSLETQGRVVVDAQEGNWKPTTKILLTE